MLSGRNKANNDGKKYTKNRTSQINYNRKMIIFYNKIRPEIMMVREDDY